MQISCSKRDGGLRASAIASMSFRSRENLAAALRDARTRLARPPRIPPAPAGSILGYSRFVPPGRGRGLSGGEGKLPMDSLHKAWQASKLVSSWAVVVDARQSSHRFYIDYEFRPFASQPDRLFLLMKKIDLMFG